MICSELKGKDADGKCGLPGRWFDDWLSVARYMALLAIWTAAAIAILASEGKPPQWPQFRGANCSGVAADDERGPVYFGPDNNAVFQVELPVGHSSPCIWGDRIFLTAYATKTQKLETPRARSLQWQDSLAPGGAHRKD